MMTALIDRIRSVMALDVLKRLVVWSVLPNKNNNYLIAETATTHISTEILIILPFSMKVNVKIVSFYPLGMYRQILQDTDLTQWKTVSQRSTWYSGDSFFLCVEQRGTVYA